MLRLLLVFLCLSFSLSLEAQEEAYQKYSTLSFKEIDELIFIEYKKGTYEKAILYLKAGQAKAKEEFGRDTLFAAYTANLGFFHQRAGQYKLALTTYLQAKDVLAKVYGEDHDIYAIALENLAKLYGQIGDYDQALTYYMQAKDILLQKGPNASGLVARIYNNLALLYQRVGNYEQALSLFTQAKDIFKKSGDGAQTQFATIINNMALVYIELGDYERALSLFIQVKDIFKTILGNTHPNFAAVLSNIADVYKQIGNLDLALSFELEAKDIRLQTLGKEHPSYASSLKTLASLQVEMGDYEKAQSLLLQAKTIHEKAFGQEHPNFALILNSLADLQIRMGNYPIAWEYLYRAISSMALVQVEQHFDKNWLTQLEAVSYPSNTHIEEILTALSQSYQLLEQDSTISNPKLKQQYVVDLALALLQKVRAQISTEQDKLRILLRTNQWVQRSIGILNLQTDQEKAFQLADQNKSVLLLQASKSEAAYRMGNLPDDLIWQNKRLLKQQAVLQAKLYEKNEQAEKDSLRNLLNQVNQDIDLWQLEVKNNYPKYYELQYTQPNIATTEVQALLDPETALIEYMITDSILHIFKISSDKVDWHQEAIVDTILQQKVSAYHESLSNYELILKNDAKIHQKYTQLAHWMYQKLLQPILKDESKIKNLIIVTDGVLGHLPFESFLVEAPSNEEYRNLHYVLRDYNISYNYSATLWKENKQQPKRKHNGKMLAMAANYQKLNQGGSPANRSPSAQQLRKVLEPLPAARAEVEALAQQYQGLFAFDSLASEQLIVEKAKEFAIIHLAMHGLLDEQRPMLSALALTENGDSLYDNFWQAHEISKMELQANLVVLSACETGYGRFEEGNGIASLARAFMYAGVPSLVVSLWQVNDQSTSIIMQYFYKHLADGKSKAQALQQAKLDYIDAVNHPVAAHPAFWSPFILIGDEAPISLESKASYPWLWWVIGAGVIILLAFFLFLIKKQSSKMG